MSGGPARSGPASPGRGGSPTERAGPPGVLAALCITQITSWGVLYYAYPVLSPAIAADTGWPAPATAAAFSAALVIAAVLGVPLGRLLDRHGPHAVMTGGSVLASLALVGVAAAPDLGWFAAAWCLAGVAMSGVLYHPAFVALTRWYAGRQVAALTALTLVAGLASTVFAPLTDALAAQLSWRGVYLTLAAILAVVTIPVHAVALRQPWPPAPPPPAGATRPAARPRTVLRSRSFLLLTAALTLTSLAMFAALIGLVPLLIARGSGATVAAWALGLGGVGQVAGRLAYGFLARRLGVRARIVSVLAVTAAATAALAVIPGPVWLLVAVAMLAGASRGITTLLQATAVTDRWGGAAYGTLTGVLSAPVTAAAAVAPWVSATLADSLGGYPPTFAVLAAVAVVAAILAGGSVPGPARDR